MKEFKVPTHTNRDKQVISKLIKDLVTSITSNDNNKIEPHEPERIIFNPNSSRSVHRPIIAEILGTHYIVMSEVIDVSINGRVNQASGKDIPFSLFFNITWDDKVHKIWSLGMDSANDRCKTIEISDSDCVLSDAVFRMSLDEKSDLHVEENQGHCRGVLLFDKKSY